MKVKCIVDVKIVADISNGILWHRSSSLEIQAKRMESLASEFNDFVRDHRSMDWVRLDVEKEYQDCCSFCKAEWEADETGCPTCCQSAIVEFENSKD
jgi:hypothetical protein